MELQHRGSIFTERKTDVSLIEIIKNSEYVSRHLKKYHQEPDYRYELQEKIVKGALAGLSLAVPFVLISGFLYWVSKQQAYDIPGDIPVPKPEGTFIPNDLLEQLAMTKERQYIETDHGMFALEFYADFSEMFADLAEVYA